MEEERILTLHPQGKKGVNMLKRRYDVIASHILSELKVSPKTLDELAESSQEKLTDFDGSVVWNIVTVKLDLEARELIKRIPNTSPHKVVLCS